MQPLIGDIYVSKMETGKERERRTDLDIEDILVSRREDNLIDERTKNYVYTMKKVMLNGKERSGKDYSNVSLENP